MHSLIESNTVHRRIYAYMHIYTNDLSEVLENVNPDLSDSEFIDKDPRELGFGTDIDIGTPMPGESELGDAPTPAFGGEGEGFEGYQDIEEDPNADDNVENEGDFDEELAAELDQALEGSQGSSDRDGLGGSDEEVDGVDGEDGDGGSGDDDDDDEGDDDDEIDSAETKRARKLLNEEIRDLEAAVDKKTLEIERSFNPLIRVSSSSSPHFSEVTTHLLTFKLTLSAPFRRSPSKTTYRSRIKNHATKSTGGRL